ncbi:tRNA (adenosine(37)-N6)-dimethylallyltransferase MiaA [Methylotenera sp. N17]|uniref:tRNA (adenosine(37)-N6)-dimethylallyltransferase MiaA n=1 Tax=Methylotenera sp. N17 TaxID=1502761 RepID=UPI0006478E47|nr:tRNA (adenosine(37)-N6)-dimethylallyltransferase MiaA [Methylotenera sp. N17]
MSLLPPAIFLMGPTASGKTNAAVYLKQHLPVELISVDSALVFKDMNIGTAKPEPAVLKQAPHFLVDIIPPTSAYSAANFREDALALMHEITARGNIPVLVGGTMLYFKSLVSGLSGLPEADATMRAQIDAEAAAIGWPGMHAKLAQIDPETAARLMPNDMQRIQRALEVYAIAGETMTQLHAKQQAQTLPYRVLKVALIPSDRSVLHTRIAIRFQQMLNDGLVEEVRVLLEKYPTLTMDSTSMRCVGYRQVLEYMQGQYSLEELCDRGIFATRQLAKRQLTWLRGMDDTLALDCLDAQLNTQVMKAVQNFLL